MSNIHLTDALRPTSPNPDRPRRRRRGQAALEAALTLLPFLALAIGVFDFGQVLLCHQMMVERVRGSLRWAVIRPFDGDGTQIRNLILYNQPTVPSGVPSTFLNLTASNIQVTHVPAPTGDPNDERLTVSIVNYPYSFVSPWIAGSVTGARPVVQSAAMLYRP